ncbi:MAG: SDR family NAD(P)-dependent oxidoreductase, partial [Pseudomonadota bacterium]
VEANMLTPIALIQAVAYGMADRGFGRIINITSASVKNPIAVLELSNGARCGLTGAVASLARRMAKHNVTINGLLPGLHDTDRVRQTLQGRAS